MSKMGKSGRECSPVVLDSTLFRQDFDVSDTDSREDSTLLFKVSDILSKFHNCFSRSASFKYFVLIFFGFMVRYDFHGVTSFIHSLDVLAFYRIIMSRLWLCSDQIAFA